MGQQWGNSGDGVAVPGPAALPQWLLPLPLRPLLQPGVGVGLHSQVWGRRCSHGPSP